MLNLKFILNSGVLVLLCFASFQVKANNIVMEVFEEKCSERMTCSIKENGVLGPRTYYAIGVGADRESALAESDIVFQESFGDMDSCGLFSGPHSIGCDQFENGMMACVRTCKPSSNFSFGRRRGNTPRCANIGGILHCP